MTDSGKERDLRRSVRIGEGPAYKNAFNLHEALEKVKDGSSASPLSEIYQNPTLTGGSDCIFDIPDKFDRLGYSSQKGFKLNFFELISIDKIVILFACPLQSYQPFWTAFKAIIDYGRPEILSSTVLYRHHVKWMDDYDIQWDLLQNKAQNIRVEFNPNKAELKPFAFFGSVFKLHAFYNARVSRLDIAVDYAMYLNLLCWICSNTSLSKLFCNSSIPRTKYFGSPESDVQIRIYDKAFALFKEHKIELGFELWRVEAQVKRIKGDDMFLCEDKAIAAYNPFSRLSFYDQYGFINLGQGPYALFVECAKAWGIEHTLPMLNYRTRIKYLEQLKSDMPALPFYTPSEIYELYFLKVYIKLVNRLIELFKVGQFQRLNH